MKFVNKVIEKFRNNSLINRIVRNRIKSIHLGTENLFGRWRLSGLVKLIFFGVDFQMFSKADDPNVNNLFYRPDTYEDRLKLLVFSELAKKSKTILDIGANTGLFTIVAAHSNLNAKIFAFEPHHINFKRLELNIQVNKINNVELINKAVGDNNSIINFYAPSDELSTMSSPSKSFSFRKILESTSGKELIKISEYQVEQVSLDYLMSSTKFSKIDLVKIDVETYEKQVFLGAKDTFRIFKPLILCEIFVDNDKMEFFNKFLNEIGYSTYVFVNDGIVKSKDGINTNFGSGNYMFSIKETQFDYYKLPEKLNVFLEEVS